MVYERYTRDRQSSDYYGRPNSQDYGRDFRSDGGDYPRSSARDYAAAGEYDRDDDRGRRNDQSWQSQGDRPRSDRDQGSRDYYGGHNDRGAPSQGGSYGRSGYAGADRDGSRYEQSRFDRDRSQRGDSYRSEGRNTEYHGSYASDGRPFNDVGRNRHADDDTRRGSEGRGGQSGGYGRQPQGYDYDDRGFIARAGDEVRSWFGDDEAERRREADARYDERTYSPGSTGGTAFGRSSNDRDDHYHSWRSSQVAEFDRDYAEYRDENRSKFHNEFSSWRTQRQGQRSSLSQVTEHMEVVGSDGSHVGTVDKVKGDRILLTKSDKDAGGVHDSIPSRWISTVDDKVTLSKSADEAKAAWKEEERTSAASNYGDRTGADRSSGDRDSQANRYGSDATDRDTTNRNRSVPGTGSDTSAGTTSDTTSGTTLGNSFSGTY